MLGLTIDGLWATVDSPEAVPAVIEPAGKELMQRFKIRRFKSEVHQPGSQPLPAFTTVVI
jgi:hypothetical protein